MKKSIKQLLSSFLVIIMLVGVVPFAGLGITASADGPRYDAYTEGIFTYAITRNNEAIIFKCNDEDVTNVIIPAEINGYPVVSLGYIPFSAESSPDGIEGTVFGDCNKLEKVSIPDSVVSIEPGTFEGTTLYNDDSNWEDGLLYIDGWLVGVKEDFGEYTIKDGTIGMIWGAFENREDLTNITLSQNLKEIPPIAFRGCSNLNYIRIPGSVVNIAICAFEGCTNLEKVDINNGLLSIDSYAFSNCNSLSNIFIPDTVQKINGGAFEYCDNIKEITVGKNLQEIGYGAFYKCDDVKNIYYNGTREQWGIIYIDNGNEPLSYATIYYNNGEIDGNVRKGYCGDNLTWEFNIALGKLDISGFGNMWNFGYDSYAGEQESPWEPYKEKILSISIDDEVTSLGNNAFNGCWELTEVNIPHLISYIGENALLNCPKLEKIEVNKENLYYASDEFGVLYTKDKSVLIQYPTGNTRTEFYVPNGVKTIGDGAFFICDNLEKVVISDTVVEINDGSFHFCGGLKEVVFGNSLEIIGVEAFANLGENLTVISLPDSVRILESYAFWDNNYDEIHFGSGIELIKSGCFDWCNIDEVYYNGTEKEWNNVVIEENNENLLNATIHFLGESEHKHELTHRTVVSTCTVAGMEYDICLDCGENFNVVTLPLASHTWSEWMTRTEATGSAEGEKYRLCSVCGKEETNSIPKLNVIEDKKTGIEIEFNDEYDSGVEIKVEEVFDGNSFELLEKTYGGVKSKVFDISTIKDGIKVQPDGKVKVRIPLPKGFGKNSVWVNYIDSSNGTVEKIPATVVNGYVEFETDHFSYYAIVEKLGKVKSVSIGDISMSYKDSVTVTPNINVDAGVDYTVTYSSSNTDVVSVDANGKLITNGKGSATITVTVTDEYGNTVTDTCNVNVSYKWWQWIIVIVLFGWIWY